MTCSYVIVEDEYMVRKGTELKMKLTGLPFELVGEAENGEEGLALIQECEPELALVDMQMAGGDGVELMENIRKAGLKTEIIIISAFTEFAYAQAGIKNKVCDYLVKPFSQEELRTAVLSVMDRLQKQDGSLERQQVENDKRLLMSYLMGVPNRGEQPKFSYFHINPEYGYFLVAEAVVETKKLELPVLEGFQEVVCLDMPNMASRKLIVGYSDERMEKETMKVFADALDETDSVGISQICRDMDKLYSARLQAQEARRDNLLGQRGVCFYKEISKPVEMEERFRYKLFYALERNDEADFHRLAEEYEAYCGRKGVCINDMINAYRSFYEETMEDGSMEEQGFPTLQQFDYLVSECERDEMLTKTIADFIYTSLNRAEGEAEDTAGIFMQLCNYLYRHFSEDLSLDLVSDLFHLSPSYVSQMFTKRLGISYIHYITQLRIDYACRLIRETELGNAAIAARCGFHDVKYYYKVFKKTMGKTTQEYKTEVQTSGTEIL